MNFSALNVDFSSQSSDPLDSKRRAHAGVKRGTFLKSVHLCAVVLSSMKIVADRQTCSGDKLLKNVNIDNLECP